MKTGTFGFIVSLGIAGLAIAGMAFAKGDPVAGKEKASNCLACHGATGVSSVPNYPSLAGQGERYLAKQIADIKQGQRVIPEMMPFVSTLSKQDINDIAAFYASQPAPVGATESKYISLGEEIYRAGNAKKGIPGCAACHSPTGQGNSLAGFPRLSGQHEAYTVKQLRAFREGDRKNDGDTRVMRTIAEKLSNKEIEAVANYIQGLYKRS